MRTLSILAIIAMLLLGLGLLVLACSSSGGGDDDSNSNDDDASADDDTSADTWTDPSSGLTWQVTPPNNEMQWADAKSYCDNLTLAGGGWHLPTISELRSLIRGCDGTVTGGVCGVTYDCLDSTCWNNACAGCGKFGGPGTDGAYWPDGISGNIDWYYWSSSPAADSAYPAWGVYFDDGLVGFNYIDHSDTHARCVRP
jgi:hypothetical protein